MPKSLLVADDSLTIRKVIAMVLATEDLKITSVDNGLEALSKVREVRPDLIVADVMMPGMSGYEVCEAIKSDPNTQGIPVLLLSGTFEAFDEARARAARADGHIGKPFESQAFVDKVRELVGMPATTEGARPVVSAMPAAAPTGAPFVPRTPAPIGPPRGAPRPVIPAAAPPLAPRTPMGVPSGVPPSGSGWPAPPAGVPGQMRPIPLTRPAAPMPGQVRMGSPAVGPGPTITGRPGVPGMPWTPAPGVSAPGMMRTAAYPPPPPAGFARPAAPMPVPGYPAYPNAVPQPMRGRPGMPPPYAPAADGGEAVLREALSRASREVIEKIAWEVVPQLAEAIIKEEIARLTQEG